MDHFIYRDQHLYAEDVAIADIAKSVPTPFYVYSAATLRHHVDVLKQALHEQTDALICFAVKANSNISVLALLADLGLGADTVSVGEIKRALTAGIPADKIVFSGVGKTKKELTFAIEHKIRQINVESEEELQSIIDITTKLDQSANIAFRVNPDVTADTLKDITTGSKENKFGIAYDRIEALYVQASKHPLLNLQGLAVHIGSQIVDVNFFTVAWQKVAVLIEKLKNQGLDVPSFDLGGGLGIPYQKDQAHLIPKLWGEAANAIALQTGCKIIVEPGRMITGNAGIMVSKVIYNKQGDDKRFLIVDAGMNDLMRPAMYKALHAIIPEHCKNTSQQPYDIVGPICETTDTFAKDYLIEDLHTDELVVFRTAGAYGAVLGNHYNSRPLAAEIMVSGDQFAVIRPVISAEDAIRQEVIAPFLKD